MGANNVVVRIVVCLFGIAAAILGSIAEGAKIKASDVEITRNGCNYPSTSANILGYIAAVLIVVGQITISIVTRCVCCDKHTSSSQLSTTIAIVMFVISWAASITGIALLITAATLSTRKEFIVTTGLCYTMKSGLFFAGGMLGIVAGSLNVTGYRFSAKNDNNPQLIDAASITHQDGIPMQERSSI